ncbi:protein of unknown function [Pricia antarctica]|uniref:Pesticidal crystal protein Cry22Aa Ig-like domain-containing protein n=1 Tax=Pricia antarctica TaxID=641691 RepID=A0A1G7B887_9FLAO|nr:DUF5011 domain-containing protein [Pricia antarctica]SDE23050.1 protein of unknown function [Pricia antarctica]
MKNLIQSTAIIFSIFIILLACTKEINLKTEVEFNVTEQHKSDGFVNEDLPTTVTVVPEEILEEFSYSYSYSVSKGEGHFRDRLGTIFAQNEDIALNPLSTTMMYVGIKPGDHLVKVIATDNYGFTEEVEIDYSIAEIPPVIWTATSPVKRIELGNSAHITVKFEKSEANSAATYKRRYHLVAGSGTLTGHSEQVDIQSDGFQPIVPGTYSLNFTPDALGMVELLFELKGSDGEEFSVKLGFEVLEEIVDAVIPEITLLGDNPLTVQRGSNYKDPGVQALDDVDGDITGDIVVDTSEVDMSRLGTYKVTYNVSDSSGNAAVEVVRTVEVIAGDDSGNPDNDILAFEIKGQIEVSIPDDVSHSVTLSVPFGTEVVVAPTVLVVSSAATVSPARTIPQNFENPVTYKVISEKGIVQEWVIRVIINAPVDSTPPVITLTGNNPQIIEVGQPYAELGATATDNFDGNVTSAVIVNNSAININQLGDYSVTYDVTDAAGNPAVQVTRIVQVADTTSPVITLAEGSLSLAVGDTYMEPGYSALDNLDGNITGKVTVGGNLNTKAVGDYTITYNVTDEAGNDAVQVTRTVEVVDTIAPVITLTGASVTMEVGEEYSEPGFSAIDNADGDITGNVTVGGNLNTNVVGSYTVTYDVGDTSGNEAVQVTRSVEVVDTTVPVIELMGSIITVGIGQTYVEPGYSANDNVDGNITGSVVVGGNLNTNALGTYTITYDVRDVAGNAAVQKIRTVEVVDTTPPVISLSGGMVSMKVYRNFPEPGYYASDNIDGNLTDRVVVGGDLNTNSVGIYSVTYTVSDNAGNTALQKSRTVEVTPLVTSFNPSTGIYRAPAGTTVTVTLSSGGSGSGTGSASGGGGSANTCWGGTGTGCGSTDSYTFIMPASGQVSFTANHYGGGSSNSTQLTIASNNESQNYSMNAGTAGSSIPTN